MSYRDDSAPSFVMFQWLNSRRSRRRHRSIAPRTIDANFSFWSSAPTYSGFALDNKSILTDHARSPTSSSIQCLNVLLGDRKWNNGEQATRSSTAEPRRKTSQYQESRTRAFREPGVSAATDSLPRDQLLEILRLAMLPDGQTRR